MAETSGAGGRGRTTRVVTKVEVTYRLETDPEGTERRLTLTNAAGEVIDGLILDEALVRKLAYRENAGYSEPRKEAGKGQWKVSSTNASSTELSGAEDQESGLNPDCVWVHAIDCSWFMYCPDMS